MNPSAHYVDNKRLLEELSVHHRLVKEAKANGGKKPRITNYVGECILLIAKKLCNRPNFMNYPFKDEMIGDGIENCLMYIDNFDPAKSNNPFAYLTQIIYYAFIRRITKEKKHLYTKHKLIQNSMIHSNHIEQSEHGEQLDQSFFENEHMNDFVKTFEEGLAKKRKEKEMIGLEKFVDEDLHAIETELVVEHDENSVNN
jgi:hypothetical protein